MKKTKPGNRSLKKKLVAWGIFLVLPVFEWVMLFAPASLTHGVIALVGHGPTGDELMRRMGLPVGSSHFSAITPCLKDHSGEKSAPPNFARKLTKPGPSYFSPPFAYRLGPLMDT